MVFGTYLAAAFLGMAVMAEGDLRVLFVIGILLSGMYAVGKEEKQEEEIKALKRELKRVSRTVGDIPCTQRAGSVGQAERRQAPSPTIKGSTAVERLFPGRKVRE